MQATMMTRRITSLLVIFAVLVVTSSAMSIFHRRIAISDSLAVRLDDIDRRLERLVVQATLVRKNADVVVAKSKVDMVNIQFLKPKAEECPSKKFACGDSFQCVSILAACDGTRDCDNGADEDEAFCKIPFQVGEMWQVFEVQKNRCQISAASRSDWSRLKVTVKNVSTSDWHPFVDVALQWDTYVRHGPAIRHQSFTCHAQYFYSSRQMKVSYGRTGEDSELLITYHFGAADQMPFYSTMRESDEAEVCGLYYYVRT